MNLRELFEMFISRNDEFGVELEDHPIGDQTKYRLHYISYYRKDEYEGIPSKNCRVVDWTFQPFMLPEGMSREDAFKVLSYLTDFIEKKFDLEPCSYKSVAALDDALNLERLGFKRLSGTFDDTEMIDLFTVAGRVSLFKKSSYYPKYFEWFLEYVSFDEVKEIYNKLGMQFYDLGEVKRNKQKIIQFPNL